MTHIAHPARPLFWLALSGLAFFTLPSFALHYGLFDSTAKEWAQAMGWAQVNLAWAWFAPLCVFPLLAKIRNVRIRGWGELGVLASWGLFILLSATVFNLRLGYAVLVLLISLLALTTQSLARLNLMRGDRFILGAFVGLLAFILVFIAYPTLSVFSSLWLSGEEALSVLQESYTLRIVKNSLSVALTAGLLSTLLGLLFALYATRIARRSAFISKFFSILPLVTPPFVVGLGVTLMLGRTGYVTHFLMSHFGVSQNWLYGFKGIVLAHTLALTPMAFMILEGALRSLNASLEEAAYSLRASRAQVFFHLTLPLLKPALANAFLVVVIQSLADFSTPLVLGGNFDVIATQIYFYIAGVQLNYAAASTLGALLLLFSLAIFFIQYAWLGNKSYITVSGKQSRRLQHALPRPLTLFITALLAIWILFNLTLYGSIFYGSFTQNWGVNNTLTLAHYIRLFGNGLDAGAFPSLLQTLAFAAISAPLTAIVSLLLGYLFVRLPFRGKKAFEFLTLLCFAVPGTVAGISYVLAFNHAPITLTGTAVIIVLSMVTRNMPIGLRAAMAGLNQLDPVLDEAAMSLKSSRFQAFRFVILPLLKPAILSALVTSFVRSMTTVSAIIFLVSADIRVATSYILNRVEDGDYGLAVAYGSTLIVLMMSLILLFDWWLAPKKRAESA